MSERTIAKKLCDHLGGPKGALKQLGLSDRNDVLRVVDGATTCYNGDGEEIPCPKPYPPIWKMAQQNLSGDAVRAASADARRDKIRVPKDIYQERLAACHRCELWEAKAFRGTGKCTKCGCGTQKKLKLASENCPHPDGARWAAYTRS